MQKNFVTVDEMIADDMFLSWFYKENDEKAKDWEKWLNENPGYQPMVDEAVAIMKTLALQESPVSSYRTEAAYTKLSSKLDQSQAPVVSMKSRKRWWISAAAAILILIAGVAYFKMSGSVSGPAIETKYGQLSQQELPDGSQVMMNANTTIELSKGWKEGNTREVWLRKGEAFFHVKKTEHKSRFIVHTNQLDVIVTGTQFNVNTRDGKTSVLLTEGSVTIKTPGGQEMTMTPGDFVEINDNKPEKKTASEEAVLAWKDNRLHFEDIPMKEVASMITNHYGVTIKLEDISVGEKLINGIMPNNNLDVLLKAIEATNRFKITRTDKTTIVIANP